MAKQMTYLITGANRVSTFKRADADPVGIGRAMTASLLLRPSTTVVATVRDPWHETAKSLLLLSTGDGSDLVLLPLDMRQGPAGLPSALQGAGVDHLDVVISNAGSSTSFISIQETTPDHLRDDFEVNAIGPFRLFQTCWPFLERSQANSKKFILITSSVGSIAGLEHENMPGVSYGASKAAANWVAKKLSVEYKTEGLEMGILHPGWVKTAMGQALADSLGVSEPPMTIEDSTRQVLQQIDSLSRQTSGKFLSFDGRELPW